VQPCLGRSSHRFRTIVGVTYEETVTVLGEWVGRPMTIFVGREPIPGVEPANQLISMFSGSIQDVEGSVEPRSDEATTFYLLDPKEHRKGGHPSALVVAEADFVNAERLRDDRDDEFLEIHMRGDIKVTVRPLAAGQTGKAAAI
jgi:hypothetical protein